MCLTNLRALYVLAPLRLTRFRHLRTSLTLVLYVLLCFKSFTHEPYLRALRNLFVVVKSFLRCICSPVKTSHFPRITKALETVLSLS